MSIGLKRNKSENPQNISLIGHLISGVTHNRVRLLDDSQGLYTILYTVYCTLCRINGFFFFFFLISLIHLFFKIQQNNICTTQYATDGFI